MLQSLFLVYTCVYAHVCVCASFVFYSCNTCFCALLVASRAHSVLPENDDNDDNDNNHYDDDDDNDYGDDDDDDDDDDDLQWFMSCRVQ